MKRRKKKPSRIPFHQPWLQNDADTWWGHFGALLQKDLPQARVQISALFADGAGNDVGTKRRNLIIADRHVNQEFMCGGIGKHVFANIWRVSIWFGTIPEHLQKSFDKLQAAPFAVCTSHENEKGAKVGAAIKEY